MKKILILTALILTGCSHKTLPPGYHLLTDGKNWRWQSPDGGISYYTFGSSNSALAAANGRYLLDEKEQEQISIENYHIAQKNRERKLRMKNIIPLICAMLCWIIASGMYVYAGFKYEFNDSCAPHIFQIGFANDAFFTAIICIAIAASNSKD